MRNALAFLLLLPLTVHSQVPSFPYRERFDSVTAPQLPAGWSSSRQRLANGDFTTSASSPMSGSAPNCLMASDARVSQSVQSPTFSFTGRIPDTLEFYERRTATFTAGVLVEAIINGDTTLPLGIGDTLKLTTANNGAYQRRPFVLPASLSDAANVRFRWRVVGVPSGGGTAVLRLEDVRVTVKRTVDLAATSLTVRQATVRSGDTLHADAVIQNRAAAGSRSGIIECYDSLRSIGTRSINRPFAEQESLIVSFDIPRITAGRHPLSVRLRMDGDEDASNDSCAVLVLAGEPPRAVLINEFMASPSPGSPEWVEVYNTTAEPVVLNGWRLSDAGPTKAMVSGTSATLASRAYAVITTDTNQFKTRFDLGIPLYQAAFSALNNSGDAVVLYDRTGTVADSLTYRSSWGGGTGRSLERKEPDRSSTDSTSWGSSRHPDGATPGRINSITQKAHDVTIRLAGRTPLYPVSGTPMQWKVSVANIGTVFADSLQCALYEDADGDSLLSAPEQLQRFPLPGIAPGDSAAWDFTIADAAQGEHRYALQVSSPMDDDPSNDRCDVPVTVGMPSGSVVISEFLYAPTGEDPEWIELFNTTMLPVRLERWSLSDNGTSRALLTGTMLPPLSYIVMTTDSLRFRELHPSVLNVRALPFAALNNTTADAVVLRDERGAVMDSVRYLPSWGGANGHSLQRYDPTGPADSSNWRSAVPTPGAENVIGRKESDLSLRRLSVERVGHEIRLTATVFNAGRRIATGARVILARSSSSNDAPSAPAVLPAIAPLDSATAEFHLTIPRSGRERIVVSVLLAGDGNAFNDTGAVEVDNAFPVRSVVINEVLYEPTAGGPEFIELLNRSADSVDLTGWSLREQPSASGTRTIVPLPAVRVAPGGFLLIVSDTMRMAVPPEAMMIAPGLSLSNSGEGLALCDLTGTVIDTLRYDPAWHLRAVTTAGRSLERIDVNGASEDGRNWSSSVHRSGSTPLRRNSIDIGSVARTATLDLSPNPFSPDRDGRDDFQSIGFTQPSGSVLVRIRIFDASGRPVRTLIRNDVFPSTGSVIWDGMDDDDHRVRMGIYIILLEAIGPSGNTLQTLRSASVVAHPLR